MSDTLTLSNPKLLKQQCLIKDSWQDSSDGATIEVTNPFSGQTIGTIPSLTEQDVYTRRRNIGSLWSP